MPSGKRYGVQPAYDIVRKRTTIAATARAIGVDYAHFNLAVNGRIRPCQAIRERLPIHLGIPIDQLFTDIAIMWPSTTDVGAASRRKHVLSWDVEVQPLKTS